MQWKIATIMPHQRNASWKIMMKPDILEHAQLLKQGRIKVHLWVKIFTVKHLLNHYNISFLTDLQNVTIGQLLKDLYSLLLNLIMSDTRIIHEPVFELKK